MKDAKAKDGFLLIGISAAIISLCVLELERVREPTALPDFEKKFHFVANLAVGTAAILSLSCLVSALFIWVRTDARKKRITTTPSCAVCDKPISWIHVMCGMFSYVGDHRVHRQCARAVRNVESKRLLKQARDSRRTIL
jgi:hypothetical protein